MLWLLRWSSGRWAFLVEILSSCCGRGGCRWHFLAPFNLRHSPCGFLYNHLCSPPTTPLQVRWFFLWWLVIVVMRYPQSPNRNQQASRHAWILKTFSMFAIFRLQVSVSTVFSTNFVNVLETRHLYWFSFNLWTQYHSSSPVLMIFAATSFSS